MIWVAFILLSLQLTLPRLICHMFCCRVLQSGMRTWIHSPQHHSLPNTASTSSLTSHRRNSEVGWRFVTFSVSVSSAHVPYLDSCSFFTTYGALSVQIYSFILYLSSGIVFNLLSVLPPGWQGWICTVIVYMRLCILDWLWTPSIIHRSVPASKRWQSSSLPWTEDTGAPGQIWLERQSSGGTGPEPRSSKVYTDTW